MASTADPEEWSRFPEPLPVESGMLVQPARPATGCEFVQVRKRAGILIGFRPWIQVAKEGECRFDIILTPNSSCECQGPAARDWMAARAEDLLPVEYFHVVFTLPAEIAQIAYWNKKAVYGLLFKASAETLTTIAADPRRLGARIGMTGVLHTWGSALTHHPHVHMIVPGGGLSPDGKRWIACRPGFFLPIRVLSRLFRRLFLEALMALHQSGDLSFFGDLAGLAEADAFAAWLAPFRKSEWLVHAKPRHAAARIEKPSPKQTFADRPMNVRDRCRPTFLLDSNISRRLWFDQ
jgi:hypothetical protein